MSVFGWIVMGLLAGGLARVVVPARGQGCLYTIVIGVLGALIGGALATAAGIGDGIDGFNLRLVRGRVPRRVPSAARAGRPRREIAEPPLSI